jgi:hypothetical protein
MEGYSFSIMRQFYAIRTEALNAKVIIQSFRQRDKIFCLFWIYHKWHINNSVVERLSKKLKKELEVFDFASFFQNQTEINKKDMPINQREM